MSLSTHLLVLVHGMWGNPAHLAAMSDKILVQARDDINLHLLVAQTNVDNYTYDGVDHGGERVADEILNEIESLGRDGRTVTRFSITGYSLGGLLSRYVIGILHQRNFFQHIAPVNFNTFATPHIGLPRYPDLISALTNRLGPSFMSRTGDQLFLTDQWASTNRSLLSLMADPDHIFYKALQLFPHFTIYANAINDPTVPYITAAIELEDPFLDRFTNGLEIILHDDYPNLIRSYHLPSDGAPRPPPSFKPNPPLVPLKFPYSMMVYLTLPILLPAALSVIAVGMLVANRNSRNRIELLEKDESYSSKLAHLVSNLEKEMMDQVIDEPADAPTTSSTLQTTSEDPASLGVDEHSRSRSRKHKPKDATNRTGESSMAVQVPAEAVSETKECKWHPFRRICESSSRTPSPSPSHESTYELLAADQNALVTTVQTAGAQRKSAGGKPILTEKQREMVASLNMLPNMKKERAFFDHTRNAHGPLICRDALFKRHNKDGAIKHWAEHFVFS